MVGDMKNAGNSPKTGIHSVRKCHYEDSESLGHPYIGMTITHHQEKKIHFIKSDQ